MGDMFVDAINLKRVAARITCDTVWWFAWGGPSGRKIWSNRPANGKCCRTKSEISDICPQCEKIL